MFNDCIDVNKQWIYYFQRECKFESEGNTSFGLYRQSDCFVECKLRSMQALCNCIPFVMPIESKSTYRSVCTLIDIPCMNQYFRTYDGVSSLPNFYLLQTLRDCFVGKWTKYFPKDSESESLELERHDSLNCDCSSTCDSTSYKIYTNTFPIEEVDKWEL